MVLSEKLIVQIITVYVVLCSGVGEGRRQSGCRRPADGHDRHEDGGEGTPAASHPLSPSLCLLQPHTHTHTHTHTAVCVIESFVCVSAAYDPGAQVRCDQEGFLQRGLSGQPPRCSGGTGRGGGGGGGDGGERRQVNTKTTTATNPHRQVAESRN